MHILLLLFLPIAYLVLYFLKAPSWVLINYIFSISGAEFISGPSFFSVRISFKVMKLETCSYRLWCPKFDKFDGLNVDLHI